MFKTLKSKITVTTIVMLALLLSAFGFLTVISRMKTKQLMVQNYSFSINASFLEEIQYNNLNLQKKFSGSLKEIHLLTGTSSKNVRKYKRRFFK